MLLKSIIKVRILIVEVGQKKMNLNSATKKNLIIKLLGSYNKMLLKSIIKVRILILEVRLGLTLINFLPISLPNHVCFFFFLNLNKRTTPHGMVDLSKLISHGCKSVSYPDTHTHKIKIKK